MKRIYKIFSAIIGGAALFASCEEFQPVFTGKYDDPAPWEPAHEEVTHTIKELAAMYETGNPWMVNKDIVISGKVASDDQPGNFYKSLYIQDETGGIELKIGKNGLYNDYRPGQTLYVKCSGLYLGMYGYKSGNYGGQGMVQLGYSDPTGDYETSYIESPLIIENHILRGEFGDKVQPVELKKEDWPNKNSTLATCPYLGKLVTIKNLYYAHKTFTLLYMDSNKDKKASSNRAFLSDATWGITTWAMSETKMKEYLYSGAWDSCQLGNSGDTSYGTIGDRRVVDENGAVSYPDIEKAAYSVSQYFSLNKDYEGDDDPFAVQIRTSGYCKFADVEIDSEVLAGNKPIDATGILTLYQGSLQLVLIDITGVKISE